MPRILIVEDDPIACEIMLGTLESGGYDVEAVSDGIAAVQATQRSVFDLVLVDYQIPEIDGVASARLMRALSSQPRGQMKGMTLVAITANENNLMTHVGSSHVFDAILPKPFAPRALLDLVARSLRTTKTRNGARQAEGHWHALGLDRRPRALCMPEPSAGPALMIASAFDCVDRGSEFDLILLTDAAAEPAVIHMRSISDRAAQVPVVDCTGCKSGIADGVLSTGEKQGWIDLVDTLTMFDARRESLNQMTVAGDEDVRLLASLFVSGQSLRPVSDPASRKFVSYSGFRNLSPVRLQAERLVAKGLLDRTFIERFHTCPCCQSHRLNVREECPSCRSADLAETAIVHHFKCAYQGPEADFRDGSRLVCPKCSAHLRHYGGDYEKPGTLMTCGQCREWTSEPAVGFVCVDCSTHTDGDAISTDDVFAYSLTVEAVALLTAPAIQASKYTARSKIPAAVIVEVERMAKEMSIEFESLAILQVSYGARAFDGGKVGVETFGRLRRLFVENMTNLLDDYGVVIQQKDCDYVIVDRGDESSLAGFSEAMLRESRKVLGHDLAPAVRIVGPDDMHSAA